MVPLGFLLSPRGQFHPSLTLLCVVRDVVAGLLLTQSCALLLVVLAARRDVAWLLALGVRVYAAPGPRKSKP